MLALVFGWAVTCILIVFIHQLVNHVLAVGEAEWINFDCSEDILAFFLSETFGHFCAK